MSTETVIVVRLTVAWWLRWYLAGVVLTCKMTGCQPDMGRVERWISRAIKLRIG